MTKSDTIKRRTQSLQLLWNTILAAGFVTFLIKYKLEFEDYFSTNAEILDPTKWLKFIENKAGILTLSGVCLATFVLLTRDSGKWQDIGQGCFSSMAQPAEWKRVHGGSVLTWVILSNIAIFLAMPMLTDNFVLFSALLASHHLNGIAWIHYMRKNVEAYFSNSLFRIPLADIHKSFIERHRQAVWKFFFAEHHMARHIVVVSTCIAAGFLAMNKTAPSVIWQVLPYVVLAAGVSVAQVMAAMERWRRDKELSIIQEERLEFDRQREASQP